MTGSGQTDGCTGMASTSGQTRRSTRASGSPACGMEKEQSRCHPGRGQQCVFLVVGGSRREEHRLGLELWSTVWGSIFCTRGRKESRGETAPFDGRPGGVMHPVPSAACGVHSGPNPPLSPRLTTQPTVMVGCGCASERSHAKEPIDHLSTYCVDRAKKPTGTAGSGRKGRSTGRACGGGATGEQGSSSFCLCDQRARASRGQRRKESRVVPMRHHRLEIFVPSFTPFIESSVQGLAATSDPPGSHSAGENDRERVGHSKASYHRPRVHSSNPAVCERQVLFWRF